MLHDDVALDTDPLADFPPFFFNSSSSSPNPNFESPLSRLKYMVAKNPDSLLNQVNKILNSSMGLEGSDKPMATVSEDNNNNVMIDVNDEKPREKRPGLGFKRSKFTLKPMPSLANATLVEPTLDIDKLSDPEELLEAFERMENAKKEIRRLKGEPLEEINMNCSPLKPRPRRPSILGESATYTHHTYSFTGVSYNGEKSPLSSQEAYNHNSLNPTPEDSIRETDAMKFSPQTKVSDIQRTMRSEVGELDELLSCNFDGLDEDGVQRLLQDKLNIKPISIGKLSLPKMPDVRRHESASLVEALSGGENSLLHVTEISKAGSSMPLNFSNRYKNSLNSQVSPPPCKSPLASISMLNKNISRLTPLKDPFSAEEIDSSHEVPYHTKTRIKEHDDQIGRRYLMSEEETNEVAASPCLPVNSRSADIEYDERLDAVGSTDQLVTSTDSHMSKKAPTRGEEDTDVSAQKLFPLATMDIPLRVDSEELIDETRETSQTGIRKNFFDTSSPTIGEDNLVDFAEASLASAREDVDMMTAPIEDDQITASTKSVGKETFNKGSAMKAIVNEGDGEMGEPVNTSGILMKKARKKKGKLVKAISKEPEKSASVSEENINVKTVNRARKGNTRSHTTDLKEPTNKKSKVEDSLALPTKVDMQLRRRSLSAAGTKWEAGIRRSTRTRMRPLEFWRGERFLYGRVHESCVSVIGVKYASPAKNEEERVVKVKSFVSDELKDLVDLASLH